MDSSAWITCTDSTATLLGIFDPSIAPALLFYSYIPIAFVSLLLGILVYRNSSNNRMKGGLFLLLTLLFTLHISNEIIQWIATPAGLIHFGWSLSLLLRLLIILTTLYFAVVYVTNKPPKFNFNLLTALISLPIIVLLPTTFNVTAFDIDWCGAIDGVLWYYLYTVQLVIITALIAWATVKLSEFLHSKQEASLNNFFLLSGMAFFLVVFIGSEFLGDITTLFEINLIGPIGMLVFISTIAYLIVRFKAFNIKLAGAQALVIGLLSLVGALLFVVQSPTSQAVAAATFFFTAIAGYFLVRSVKKEIKQREELQVLTEKLAKANDRLKELDKLKSEFVSIASHQMRSPLTSMRGYASMVLDGSYGAVPDKAREAIQRIADSSAFMAKMIENYLNVSRIESGNMKYELSDFNLKLETEKVVDDKRQEAMKKGLLLTFKSNLQGQGIVHADIGKTLEIVHNLLNNALKYTPKGTIDVTVHDDPKKKKIYVDIHDSGIGMKPEDIAKLFGKFERAENANTVNITGTGLGLYVARTMALAMKGEITASSSGQGQGSTFRFELPMMM